MKSLAEMNCNKPLVNVGDFLKSQVKNTIRSQRLIEIKSCTAKEPDLLLCHLYQEHHFDGVSVEIGSFVNVSSSSQDISRGHTS